MPHICDIAFFLFKVNLSRLPKPRLPEFIRNRLRPNNPETEDDISTTDAVDNTAFADDESQVEQVQVIMPFPPMTDISQTDIEPPSYEEAMTTSIPSYSYMQPEEPAPLYEDVVSETPTMPAFQSSEHSATADDIIIYENDNVMNQNEASNNTDGQNMNSDVVIVPELDTTSILNLYLNDFAVELSDNYSTDSDFDTQSNTTILSAELNSGAHQLQNENGKQNEMCGGDIPTELRADTDSDWSSECASSDLRQEQIDDFRALNNGCDTQTSLRFDSESDWDSQSDSLVLPTEHITVRQSVQNENDTQTALRIDSESDWDSQSDSLVLPTENITVRQSVQNENDMGYVVSGCDTQNVINFGDSQNADRDSSTHNEVRDSDEENAHSVSDIRNALSARTGINSIETHTEASEIDDEHNDMPVSPPNYDEAVPPPYYYDYIANVGRYKQNSFEDSEA
jgi:hypothetical protein